MVRAIALGNQSSICAFVEAAFWKADGEGVHRFGRLLRRERREHRRVDTARQEHADRHVREKVRPHGVAQPRAQLFDELGFVVASQLIDRHRPRTRVALDAERTALLPDQHVPGRELARVAEDRERGRNRIEGEKCLERVEVDLALRQRAELGCELERVPAVAVVERLDAVAVACEHEPPASRVPERNREHAAQPAGVLGPVLLVEMQVHLGVAVRAKRMAVALELAPQLRVVVDLAVLDDDTRAVLVRDRLIASREVDDREPPGPERDGAV